MKLELSKIATLLAAILVSSALGQPPRVLERDPPAGARIPVKDGELFVPAGLRPSKGKIDIVVHLHGAPWVVQQALAESKWNAVLVALSFKGLSSAYDRPFADRKRFGIVLDESRTALRKRPGFAEVAWRRIVLSSFSAGYGGVRRILADPRHVQRIDAVILADSLHAGYDAARSPKAAQMKPFREWARRAAKGEKLLWTTHSAVKPPDYASTSETNDDLVRAIGARRQKAASTNPWGMTLTSTVDVRGFQLRGYGGATGKDHMRHLWFLGEPFREVHERLR